MNEQTRGEWLRWICVLPAAVVGGLIARYIGQLVGRAVISGWGSTSDSDVAFAFQLLVYALSAGAFVLAGAFTAPRRRGATAVVLAIVSVLLSLLTHIVSQSNPGTTNYLHLAAESSGAALAAAYLCFRKKPVASSGLGH